MGMSWRDWILNFSLWRSMGVVVLVERCIKVWDESRYRV